MEVHPYAIDKSKVSVEFVNAYDELEDHLKCGRSRAFALAIFSWRMSGNLMDIATTLRSDQPLTKSDREWLAEYLEGKKRLRRGKPPWARLRKTRKRFYIEQAAGEAKRLIDEWTAKGQKRRGLKSRAIEAATKKHCPPEMDPIKLEESVINFLNRGGIRWVPEGGLVDFMLDYVRRSGI
jgi:hypothetical protein